MLYTHWMGVVSLVCCLFNPSVHVLRYYYIRMQTPAIILTSSCVYRVTLMCVSLGLRITDDVSDFWIIGVTYYINVKFY